MSLRFSQDAAHLYHSLKATQQGILGFTLTYGNFQRHNTPTHSRDTHKSGTWPMCVFATKLALSAQSNLVVAITAIYGFTSAGVRWYSCVFAALRACCMDYLPPGSGPVAVVAISVTLYLPCCAAPRTALWIVGIAFRCEKLLLLSTESEGSPAIGTLNRLVLKTHWMTSSLLGFSWSSGHPTT